MIDIEAMFHGVVASCPQLARGRIWCRKCGASRKVDSATCLRTGWPKCCGETMTIDSPGERVRDRDNCAGASKRSAP